jgi:hypothetical protein
MHVIEHPQALSLLDTLIVGAVEPVLVRLYRLFTRLHLNTSTCPLTL